MPLGPHELLVEALEMFDHWETVNHDKPPDCAGVIHGGAEGDERPAIMAYDGEMVVAEVPRTSAITGPASLTRAPLRPGRSLAPSCGPPNCTRSPSRCCK